MYQPWSLQTQYVPQNSNWSNLNFLYALLIHIITRSANGQWIVNGKKKKSFFIMMMNYLTHLILYRQKSMNWVSNRFRIHRILQIWPPATIICSQTSWDGCVVGVLSQSKKLNGKQKCILEDLTNRIMWKA